jgi:hypothetical protein
LVAGGCGLFPGAALVVDFNADAAFAELSADGEVTVVA